MVILSMGMIRAVEEFARPTGTPVELALFTASRHPANFIVLCNEAGSIAPAMRAELDPQLCVRSTWIARVELVS